MKKFAIISICSILLLIIFMLLLSIILFPVKYKEEVLLYSKKYNLSPSLIASIINVESGYDKNAKSNAGAFGLMQILPSTADEIATKLEIENYDILNIDTNIEFGCYYLSYLLSYYQNDLTLALCAYNAGLNNVNSWIKTEEYFKDGTLIYIPFKETRNYIKKINFNKFIYSLKYS